MALLDYEQTKNLRKLLMRSNDDKDMAVKRQRAIYRACHRGTREMDFLLGHFAKAKVQDMQSAELAAFERLMEIADPVLAGALIDGHGEFEPDIAPLIAHIINFHKNKQ